MTSSAIDTFTTTLHNTLCVLSNFEQSVRLVLHEFHVYGADVCLAFAEAYTQKDESWRDHT